MYSIRRRSVAILELRRAIQNNYKKSQNMSQSREVIISAEPVKLWRVAFVSLLLKESKIKKIHRIKTEMPQTFGNVSLRVL
jgi:hypothetical protein